jgi:hypothetical protein
MLCVSHAPLLALFSPDTLIVAPPEKGAKGLYNFAVKPAVHEILSRWTSTGVTRRVVMRQCNLLSKISFPREGSGIAFACGFEKEGGRGGYETEVVWDLRGVGFGRNFFEYFVGMRETEGSIGGGGGGGKRTVVVEDDERKGWMLRGMERRPPAGRVGVIVRDMGDL